jgi:flagellar basal-body rod modification protein FlgD
METASTTATSNIPAALTQSTSVTPKGSEDQKSEFLKLLVAQLKGQNPLDPMDGMQFVSQLAQFSSVEELINIRTLLEANSKAATNNATGTNTEPPTNTDATTNTDASNPFKA